MPAGSIETAPDCSDFLMGCLLMGTGGGGSFEEGEAALLQALADGLELGWVDADDIDDNTLTATVYGNGSIAPDDGTLDELLRSLHLGEPGSEDEAMLRAVTELGSYLGTEVGCLVPVELGAGNTPPPIVAAARLGISVVDGDYAGRASPEEMQSTPFLAGKASHPSVSVDLWGNVAVLASTVNPYMFERIGKMLAIAAILNPAVAATPLTGAEMKRIVVRGTLTRCLEIGRAVRRAREGGDDPVDAALEIAGGWRLFGGRVVGKEWEDRDGYMFGTIVIESSDRHELRVWFKNENHVTWLDGEPWVCSPDLVSLVDPSTSRAFTNTEVAEGDEVVAVAMPGLEICRRPEFLDVATGPRYYGFDIDYIPVEDLV
jgi:DUF917 family protein